MKENDLILELKKIELKKFFDLNENLLKIEVPFEKWNNTDVLFTTNSQVKGGILFKINRVKFKLRIKYFWTPYSIFEIRDEYSLIGNRFPIKKGQFIFPCDKNGEYICNQISSLYVNLRDAHKKYLKECEKKEELERIKELRIFQRTILTQLDKNGDGAIISQPA